MLLLENDTSINVSFIGFKVDTSSPSLYEKRRPKRAFEALLVVLVVVLLAASCSPPPTDGVVVVVLSPVVEADTGVIVVDAKTIVSVKIVAAAAVVARWVLCSRDIFLL